ncbi:CoA transferase [Nonomuraea lactucae]|uniref:CoA transferase n=1 Tax=Nonomuraea lactucae TaxID=2249762 RepID=UPI000DE55927|nr:CoA transferase [Nonomuraea lactucae]
MAYPATVRTAQPLDDLTSRTAGAPGLTATAARHLAVLGAEDLGATPSEGPGTITLAARDGHELTAEVAWARIVPAGEVSDESTAQAATGVMHVHGRRDGEPRGLAADYLTTACAVLTVQGLLAALLGRARGAAVAEVRTGVDLAGLLSVGQYLAAATAEEDEAVPFAPGGPPFCTADGIRFEVETLDPEVWVAFWRELGAAERLAASAWRSFQFRYATACSPLSGELHDRARAAVWHEVRRAAELSGASLCALRSLSDRLAEYEPAAPWLLSPFATASSPRSRNIPDVAHPLAGFTVLEAGRRIQAPLTAHLLGMLGAEVVRVEPPGGDPLRGMPPTCGELSARWLALNRGKAAVEIDIKSSTGRAELRELASGADVFLHNWAPGTAERLGLDDGDLSAVNPGLVYAYTSGWADRIPDAPLGTDFMVQARTGVGEAVRPEGEPPAPSLMTLLDVLGGLLGAEAVLAGLLLRERTGAGVRVDSSLLGAAELLTEPALRRAVGGIVPRAPRGFRHPLPASDGWVAVPDDCADPARKIVDAGGELTAAGTVALLRREGLRATFVTTALNTLPGDPRFAAALTRDEHGAVAVPAPWRFA